jgi:hypothetical protein
MNGDFMRGVVRGMAGLMAACGLLMVGGCAGLQLADRANLSRYIMKGDRDVLADSLTEHMYFSREAASGGQGVGGGGCGCN